jgi:hypothetical protein
LFFFFCANATVFLSTVSFICIYICRYTYVYFVYVHVFILFD